MNLSRDRAAFVLAFVLPVAFFSIFAAIFAGAGPRGDAPDLRSRSWTRTAATSRGASSRASRREAGLSVGLKPGDENAPGPLLHGRDGRAGGAQGRRAGRARHPEGLRRTSPIAFGPGATRVPPPDPRRHAPTRSRRRSSERAPPEGRDDVDARRDGAIGHGGARERWSGGLTPEQKARMETAIGEIDRGAARRAPRRSSGTGRRPGGGGLVAVETGRPRRDEEESDRDLLCGGPRRHVPPLLGVGRRRRAHRGGRERHARPHPRDARLDDAGCCSASSSISAGVGVVQLVLMFVWGALLRDRALRATSRDSW